MSAVEVPAEMVEQLCSEVVAYWTLIHGDYCSGDIDGPGCRGHAKQVDLVHNARTLLPQPPCEVAVRVATKVRGRAAFLEWTCELPSGHEGQHQDEDSGPWSVEDATPARPEPRVWNAGDPEPEGVEQISDRDGDIWDRGTDGWWHSPETRDCRWEHIARKWSPLTEVRAGGAR